jgi:hypothetical protein
LSFVSYRRVGSSVITCARNKIIRKTIRLIKANSPEIPSGAEATARAGIIRPRNAVSDSGYLVPIRAVHSQI